MSSKISAHFKQYARPRAWILAPVFHLALFSLRRQKVRFEKGMFIVSIDVDVGNEKLGMINQGKFDRDVNDYYGERFVEK